MIGDRRGATAYAAAPNKKLGKFTSTKMRSIYPTLTGAACSRLATGAAQAQAGPGAHEPVPARGFVGSVPHADPAAP